MEQNVEIRRLLDLMPASGRMMTKIVSKPEQRQIIDSPLPRPWQQQRQVYINFDLWRRLSKPQRDLFIGMTLFLGVRSLVAALARSLKVKYSISFSVSSAFKYEGILLSGGLKYSIKIVSMRRNANESLSVSQAILTSLKAFSKASL